jgi:hypothetical protein
LTWDEFQELFEIVESSLKQKGRRRRRKRDQIDRFFIVMVHLTSGCMIKQVAMSLNVSKSFVWRTLQKTLDNIQVPLEQFFPANQANIQCELTFENHPEVFCIVDTSPAFIQRPARHQTDCYSGKYKRHYVKVQACLTPDGQCVPLAKVYRGRTHDKAIFDSSGLADFLIYRAPGSDAPHHRIIIADLGYVGITHPCPNALLPHEKLAGGQLTADQKRENQILSRDRILIENCFGQWKTGLGCVTKLTETSSYSVKSSGRRSQ